MNKFLAIPLFALLAAGCTGDAGPTGPQGLQGDLGPIGPQGPPGTAMVMVTGTFDAAGDALVHLPAAAGTISNPPLVGCYVADVATSSIWLVVSHTDDTFGACAVLEDGDHVDVGFIDGPSGWALRVIAVFTP